MQGLGIGLDKISISFILTPFKLPEPQILQIISCLETKHIDFKKTDCSDWIWAKGLGPHLRGFILNRIQGIPRAPWSPVWELSYLSLFRVPTLTGVKRIWHRCAFWINRNQNEVLGITYSSRVRWVCSERTDQKTVLKGSNPYLILICQEHWCFPPEFLLSY